MHFSLDKGSEKRYITNIETNKQRVEICLDKETMGFCDDMVTHGKKGRKVTYINAMLSKEAIGVLYKHFPGVHWYVNKTYNFEVNFKKNKITFYFLNIQLTLPLKKFEKLLAKMKKLEATK